MRLGIHCLPPGPGEPVGQAVGQAEQTFLPPNHAKPAPQWWMVILPFFPNIVHVWGG